MKSSTLLSDYPKYFSLHEKEKVAVRVTARQVAYRKGEI